MRFVLPVGLRALFLCTLLGILVLWPAAVELPPRPVGVLAFVVFLFLSSCSAACFCFALSSLFCPAFFLISSRLSPTTARPIFVTRRVRFLVVVSARPFLWSLRHACVHTSFAGFLRWRVRE